MGDLGVVLRRLGVGEVGYFSGIYMLCCIWGYECDGW